MPEPRVMVAVLNWNHDQTTLACLAALDVIDYPHLEIVVVDNASLNDSVARIRAQYPAVRIVVAPENLGYAGGNKLALDIALAENVDLFWILNPDAMVRPTTLRSLVDAYQQHGDTLYGSVPVYRANDDQPWRMSLKLWAMANGQPRFGAPAPLDGTYDALFASMEAIPVSHLHGGSMLIPVRVIQTHGFMETDFFLYSEETDYCLRLWKAGVPSMLVPASVVTHHPAGAHKHDSALKPVVTYYQVRNRLVLTRRHGTNAAFARAVIVHVGYATAWLLRAPTMGRTALVTASYTLRGVVDALRGRMGKTVPPERFLRD